MTKAQHKIFDRNVERFCLRDTCDICYRGPGMCCINKHGRKRKAHAVRFRRGARWLPARLDPRSSKFCGCDGDTPCVEHVEKWADEVMNSPAFAAWELSQVPGEIDMAGPEDDK